MRRIVVMLVAALLTGGMAMAQERHDGKRPDPKERAERMTERMAKEYSLNDTQKQQLLEANRTFMEQMGDVPGGPGRGPGMKPGKGEKKDSIRADRGKGKRPEMSEEKKAEMEAARTAYEAKLKEILTPEQYADFTKKMSERRPPKMEKRK